MGIMEKVPVKFFTRNFFLSSSGYSQPPQGTYLIRLNYNHILFISIAILVNNAFKTVQQSAKDKKDICRRADARQRYLTQDFTL